MSNHSLFGAIYTAVSNTFSGNQSGEPANTSKTSQETKDATNRSPSTTADRRPPPPESYIQSRYRILSAKSKHEQSLISSSQKETLRTRLQRDPDELRLTGDYTKPANGVLIDPAEWGATPSMKPKPQSGGFRPMNTLTPSSKSHQEKPTPRKTYAAKSGHRHLINHNSDLFTDFEEHLPGPRRACKFGDEDVAPRKRRKMRHQGEPQIIELEPDDVVPVNVRSSNVQKSEHRSSPTRLALSTSSRSHSSLDSGRIASKQLTSSFDEMNKLVDPRRKPSRRPSKEAAPEDSYRSPLFGGIDAIQVDSDDELASTTVLRKPKQTSNTNTMQSTRPMNILGLAESGNGIKSKYFEDGSSVQIYAGNTSTLPRKAKGERRNSIIEPLSPRLSKKFKRDDGHDSDIDELQMSEDRVISRLNKPSQKRHERTVHAANSSTREKMTQTKTSAWQMLTVISHELHLSGLGIDLQPDSPTNSVFVRQYNPDAGRYDVKSTIHCAKVNRGMKDDESGRVRLLGPRDNFEQLWYSLHFASLRDYRAFLAYLPITVKLYPKGSEEMDKIFEKPKGVSNASKATNNLESEIALLTARAERDNETTNGSRQSIPAKTLRSTRSLLVSNLRPTPSMTETKYHTLDDEANQTWTFTDGTDPPVTLRSTRTRQAKGPEPKEPSPERYSQIHGLGPPWDKPVTFKNGRRRALVDFQDLERLDEGEFLNDNIIDFYMLWAYTTADLPSNKVYMFNTHFYTALANSAKGQKGAINYSAVERWTSRDDIFGYDYIVVPINEAAHWYVAIICNLSRVARVLHESSSVESKQPSLHLLDPDERSIETIPLSTKEHTDPEVAPKTLIRSSIEKEDDLDLFQEHTRAQQDQKFVARNDVSKEEDEWPDPRENLLSKSSSPFHNTTGMQKLSIDAERVTEGGLLGSSPGITPTEKSKKSKRKSGPPLKKYDPEEPIIIVLDSLGATHPSTVRHLKQYIVEEGKSKRQIDVNPPVAMNARDIPLQDNFCDCGLYLLGYLEKFFEEPQTFVEKILQRRMDVTADWPRLDARHMRGYIRDRLFELAAEQQAERKKLRAEKRAASGKAMPDQEAPTDGHGKTESSPKVVQEAKMASPRPSSPHKQQSPVRRPSPEVVIPTQSPRKSLQLQAIPTIESTIAESPKISPKHPFKSKYGYSPRRQKMIFEGEDGQSNPKSPTTHSAPSGRKLPLGSSEEPIEIPDSQGSLKPEVPVSIDPDDTFGGNLISQLVHSSQAAESPEPTKHRALKRTFNPDAVPGDEPTYPSLVPDSPIGERQIQVYEDLERPPTRGKAL